jgi:hypothetical protein
LLKIGLLTSRQILCKISSSILIRIVPGRSRIICQQFCLVGNVKSHQSPYFSVFTHLMGLWHIFTGNNIEFKDFKGLKESIKKTMMITFLLIHSQQLLHKHNTAVPVPYRTVYGTRMSTCGQVPARLHCHLYCYHFSRPHSFSEDYQITIYRFEISKCQIFLADLNICPLIYLFTKALANRPPPALNFC